MANIDTVNNTILLCIFCLGLVCGGAIAVFLGGK
jgi:uncharacterized membrane protein YoaK (UPF0700 family)